ncbi:MAG: hypothetical protein EU543_06240 [Promethearchaeota archaeon]|nr:MAG: hypothetical protein EU543_06240 [Candidatus Lokiarchaeota archaeon]
MKKEKEKGNYKEASIKESNNNIEFPPKKRASDFVYNTGRKTPLNLTPKPNTKLNPTPPRLPPIPGFHRPPDFIAQKTQKSKTSNFLFDYDPLEELKGDAALWQRLVKPVIKQYKKEKPGIPFKEYYKKVSVERAKQYMGNYLKKSKSKKVKKMMQKYVDVPPEKDNQDK